MALSVSDCMKIGALRTATVVAGKNGLHRIVESVSLLEFDGFEIDGLVPSSLRGNEMAISSLACFAGQPEKLVTFIGRFLPFGLSCMVVFYFGYVMKELPPEMIALCDQAGIPVIVMPCDMQYAYVDVVMPVAEAIVNDKRSNGMFVSDTLQQLIYMDDDQQNIHSLLELLRSRVHCDLILTDTALQALDWSLQETEYSPTELLEAACAILKGKLPLNPSTLLVKNPPDQVELRFQPIRSNKLVGMLIAVNRSEENFDIDALTQAAEVLKLFLRVWRLTRSRLCELDALLQGGPAGPWERKVKRLTVLRNARGDTLDNVNEELALVNMLDNDSLFTANTDQQVTYFSGSIVIAEFRENGNVGALLQELQNKLGLTLPIVAGSCNVLSGRTNVQQVHTAIVNALPVACMIFPDIQVFGEEKITFANEIYRLRLQLGAKTDAVTGILEPLIADDKWPRHKETLETLYLDCNGSVTGAAQRLDVHINTMKYRLKGISDLLGQDVLSALCSSRIVLALALLRAG